MMQCSVISYTKYTSCSSIREKELSCQLIPPDCLKSNSSGVTTYTKTLTDSQSDCNRSTNLPLLKLVIKYKSHSMARFDTAEFQRCWV